MVKSQCQLGSQGSADHHLLEDLRFNQSFPPVDGSGAHWTLEEGFSGLLDPGKKGGEAHNSLQVPKEMSLHFLALRNRTGKKVGGGGRNKPTLKQEALRLPIRKPNFISTPVILNLFGLVLPCFCLFL